MSSDPANPHLGPTEVDDLISRVNQEQMWKVRKVRHRDLNDHIPELWAMRNDPTRWEEAITLYSEIIETAEQLPQYDSREPDLYWYERKSLLLSLLGRYEEAIGVLERWLSAWPAERRLPNPAVFQVRANQRRRTLDRIDWLKARS